MRVMDWKMKLARLCLVMILCVSIAPGGVFADDGTPSGTASPVKIDTPKPGLTEREQYLLDRVEQLERRVEELESKSGQPAAPAATVSQPGTKDAAISAATPSATSATPATVTPVNTISSSSLSNPVIGPQGQATEKGKSGGTATGKAAKAEPFAFADFTWLNGNSRTKDTPYATSCFTPEIRADVDYNYSFNHPADDTIGGSSEVFRSNELHVTQLGVGGDFHYDNVRARVMTQFGLYSQTTPRNDASPARGQWNLDNAYRYLSEAYGGYHIDALNGINIDAGIFMSYIGLFSYYNFDNWAYQPSYVSSNTPWFFEGLCIQVLPTAHLKIEPWIINGWQSYGSANSRKGFGGQIKWTPRPWMNIISNNYGLGHDDLYIPNRSRIHTDDSIEIKYYDKPEKTLDKMAFTFTGDMGCEFGGGVSCHGNTAGGPKQSFIGYMLYNRAWFKKDKYAITIGGGQINNPGRYLVLIPPINGESASSAG